MDQKTTAILDTAPLMDASMEMRQALERDLRVIKQLQLAENAEMLKQGWEAHIKNMEAFDLYASAITQGAQIDGITIKARINLVRI